MIQTVDVIPGLQPQGFTPGEPDSAVEHLSGNATGVFEAVSIDPINITGHTYIVTFKDTAGETAFDVYDENAGKYVVESFKKIWKEEETDLAQPRPIFDGIGLKVINHNNAGELARYWEKVANDTSDYSFSAITPFNDTSAVLADYEVVFGDSSLKYDKVPTSKKVPFKVYNVTRDPEKKSPLLLFVMNPSLDWKSGDFIYLRELDTLAFNPDSNIVDTVRTLTWKFTVYWTDSSKAPSKGDIFLYRTKKPFTPADVYEIRTHAEVTKEQGADLSKIKVVPNPYIVYNLAEQASRRPDRFSHQLRFTHLPRECTIKIYTISGNLIKTIKHSSATIGE